VTPDGKTIRVETPKAVDGNIWLTLLFCAGFIFLLCQLGPMLSMLMDKVAAEEKQKFAKAGVNSNGTAYTYTCA